MSNEYRHNHYVPEWYQKRFILSEQKDKELFYLDFNPDNFIDPRGIAHPKKAVRKQGTKYCFAENDLYTARFGSVESTKIEQSFFGEIDHKGRIAVDYFTNFSHPSVDHDAFTDMMRYMSTQKLRTPKGLDWVAQEAKTENKFRVLNLMLQLQNLYCALWAECIWLIADASQSSTKFIISDHPVTVYNRICGPRSQWCRGCNDPDIWFNATQTIFPLSIDKVLILTNLSWVRNPYQHERSIRPNPNPFRSAMFKYTEIQTLRHLSELEVCEINYIIKRRAYRFIASSKEEWLYPENKIQTTQWNMFGKGYLLMPDPRAVNMGGEIFIGHNDGSVSAYDEYGRRPWQQDYGKESKHGGGDEFKTLYRFKGEFARLFGPYRRGRTFEVMSLDRERDDDEFHQYHLGLEKRRKNKTN